MPSEAGESVQSSFQGKNSFIQETFSSFEDSDSSFQGIR
jgi:hypothetical protein